MPRIMSVFCKRVSVVQKSRKLNKNGNHASVRYVTMPVSGMLSVTGIQFRAVPMSLMAFSGHKTMMYTLEEGSTTFTNLRRDQGLEFQFILNGRVDIYTLQSKMEIEEW